MFGYYTAINLQFLLYFPHHNLILNDCFELVFTEENKESIKVKKISNILKWTKQCAEAIKKVSHKDWLLL